MAHKLSSKENHKDLQKSIETILVANDAGLRPYIEIFQYSGENVFQQQLGTLIGVFEIKDNSEDSAYIVNFLASTVKKEYFSNPKRPSAESFEAALHKINLALSEIANQGNVEWMGKMDAVVCALDKNQIHFSAVGNAKILLVREKNLSEISEGIDEGEQELNPLKTFTNISSGKLSPNDKFIITTEELFHVFSQTELKKGSLRFPKDKFFQFIKTALVNELAIGGTVIVDIEEAPLAAPEKELHREKSTRLNAFSEKTFQQSERPENTFTAEEEADAQKNYTDQKTGHIYVQGEYAATENKSLWSRFSPVIKEKLSDFSFWLKAAAKKTFLRVREIANDSGASLIEKIKRIRENQKRRAILKAQEKEAQAEKAQMQQLRVPPSVIPAAATPPPTEENRPKFQLPTAIWLEKIQTWKKTLLSKIFPSFLRLRNIFRGLNQQQKIYGLLIIAFIIIAPVGWIKYQAWKNKPVPVVAPVHVPTIQEIFAGEKNIRFTNTVTEIFTAADVSGLVFVEDKNYAIGAQKITLLGSEIKEYPFPADSGITRLAAPMKDLALIFVLTDQNKIISFNAISNKFQNNQISFPENARISTLATYLTYLYAVDAQNNQIYRYPRAEGGFGAKADWLKTELNLSTVSDIAIDENVYLANNDSVVKLFRGQKQDFNPEQSATPLKFNQIFTNSDTQNIYTLDTASGRLAKFAKAGELLAQYYAEQIKNARDLIVDEKNNKAYFSTAAAVLSLDLQ